MLTASIFFFFSLERRFLYQFDLPAPVPLSRYKPPILFPSVGFLHVRLIGDHPLVRALVIFFLVSGHFGRGGFSPPCPLTFDVADGFSCSFFRRSVLPARFQTNLLHVFKYAQVTKISMF